MAIDFIDAGHDTFIAGRDTRLAGSLLDRDKAVNV